MCEYEDLQLKRDKNNVTYQSLEYDSQSVMLNGSRVGTTLGGSDGWMDGYGDKQSTTLFKQYVQTAQFSGHSSERQSICPLSIKPWAELH